MPLLSKLIEAQINAPLTDDKVIKPKRNSNDPVKQIRKIRKIERKFERVQKKEKIMQEAEKNANLIAEKTLPGKVYNSGFYEKLKYLCFSRFLYLPGKKLPIWKKRVTQATPTTPQDGANESDKLHLTNVTTRNYGKFAKEQIKMPRQLREIQENLNFEKVRQQTASDDVKKDMNIDEIKEFMDEQRKNDNINDEDDDDDYYDNDAGLDYDESQEVEEDEEELLGNF